MTLSRSRSAELTHEDLWNSCIDMAAQLPLRARRIVFVNGMLEDPGKEPVHAAQSETTLYWAGGIATGFLQFTANILSRPRQHPTSMKPLEFDILLSMGEPRVTPLRTGYEVVDLAPSKTRYPKAAVQVARACMPYAIDMSLEWLPENYETRRDDVESVPRCEVEHPANVANYTYTWAQGSVNNMVGLTEMRRRLAPVIGQASGVYQAEYEAMLGAHDKLFPDSPYHDPFSSRVSDLRTADLHNAEWLAHID
jgi:hypothetical protein